MKWIDERVKTYAKGAYSKLEVPNNFQQSAPLYDPKQKVEPPNSAENPQTIDFLQFLELPDIVSQKPQQENTENMQIETEKNPEEISLDL
jgi:hypothetical protein